MPQYKITDNKTGKSLKITGNNAPTQQDVEGIFSTYYNKSGYSATPTEAPKSLGGFAGNVVKSTGNLIGDTAKGLVNVFNPNPEKNTLANVGKLAVGTAGLLMPKPKEAGEDFQYPLTEQPRALGQYYKQRYGEDLGKTLYEDPAGVASDVAMVVGAGSGLARGASSLTKGLGMSDDLGKLGTTLSKAERIIDPIQAPFTAGKAILNKADDLGDAARVAGKADDVAKKPIFSKNMDNIELADKYGVDLPASAQYKSPVIQQAEAMTVKGLFGGKTADKIGRATDDITELRKSLRQTEAPTHMDLTETGEMVKTALTKHVDNFRKTSERAYDVIPNLEKITADTSSTKKFLQDIVEAKSRSKVEPRDLSFYKQALSGFDSVSTAEDLRETLKAVGARINDNADIISKSDIGSLKALYGNITSDLDNTLKVSDPASLNAIKQANKYYADNIEKINSKLGKDISSQSSERILNAVVKPNNAENIRLLKEVMGDAEMEAL